MAAKRGRKAELLRLWGDRCWICGGALVGHGGSGDFPAWLFGDHPPQRGDGGYYSTTVEHLVEVAPPWCGPRSDYGNLRLAHKGCNSMVARLGPDDKVLVRQYLLTTGRRLPRRRRFLVRLVRELGGRGHLPSKVEASRVSIEWLRIFRAEYRDARARAARREREAALLLVESAACEGGP